MSTSVTALARSLENAVLNVVAQVAHPATTRRGTRGRHVVDVVEMGGSPKNPLTMVAPTATTVAIGAMDEMIPLYH